MNQLKLSIRGMDANINVEERGQKALPQFFLRLLVLINRAQLRAS